MALIIHPGTNVDGDPDHTPIHNDVDDVLALLAQVAAQYGGTLSAVPATNLTALQNLLSAGSMPSGLKYVSGGGVFNAAAISSVQGAGYQGVFLDPNYVWDFSGLAVNGVENFTIESRMQGSIGWGANVSFNSTGYIKTDTGSPTDGVSVYASSPAGSPTQGVIFRNLVFKGGHSGGNTMHWGGGHRRCALDNVLIQNTSATSGSYAFVSDTAISNNNGENCQFTRLQLAGAYAALGLGIGDVTQHTNDTLWTDLVTSGGTYGINAASASAHTFLNYYDRSSPATATVLNSAGVLQFIGGEDLNNSGLTHQVTGGTTICVNRTNTAGGASISSGALSFLGRCRLIGTIAMTGGTVAMADPSGSWSSCTITGSAGTLLLSGQYSPGSGPTHSGFTGTLHTSNWT